MKTFISGIFLVMLATLSVSVNAADQCPVYSTNGSGTMVIEGVPGVHEYTNPGKAGYKYDMVNDRIRDMSSKDWKKITSIKPTTVNGSVTGFTVTWIDIIDGEIWETSIIDNSEKFEYTMIYSFETQGHKVTVSQQLDKTIEDCK